MFVYGELEMAGFEIIPGPALPDPGEGWEGRVIQWNGQVYYMKSGAWEAVAVTSAGVLPPQLGEDNKLLSTDGLNTFWAADPSGHVGEFLSWDGVSHIWDKPLGVQTGKADWLLSSDGSLPVWVADPSLAAPGQFLQWDGAFHVWATPPAQLPPALGEDNKILISDGTAPFWGADPSAATPGQFLQWNGTAHVWGNAPTGMPPMAGKADWLLTNTGLAPNWTADPSGATPGQFLQWNGAVHVWADPPGSLPAMAGHAGEWLRTDGLINFWEAIERVDLVPIPGEANYVLINDALGALSSEQFLNQSRGGFNQDVTGFDGFVQASSGVFFAQPLLPGDLPTGIPADNIGSGLVDNAHFEQLVGIGRYESTANIAGGVLSVNADPTKFDLSPGDGIIVDYSIDPHDPSWVDVPYLGGTALTVTNLATSDQTYIMINSAGSIIQQATFPSPTQLRDNIYIGVLAHANRTSVSAARSIGNHAESVGNHMFDFWNAVGPFNIVGNTIAPNGSNLTFQKSAGFMFSAFYNQVVSPKDPHRIPMLSAAPVSFGYRTRDSSLGGTPPDQTLIDPTRYDLGGVVTAIGATATNATVQRVFLLPTGQIRVQYGQQIYTNLATALANMGQELFVTNPALVGYAILIGYIVMQQNATTLNSTLFARVFSAARFEIGPAAGALPSTTQQQAYDNSAVPVIVLSADVGAFNIRDASTPLGTDLFSVTDFAGTAKYIQVDMEGIKSNKINPSLVLVSDGSGAIVSNADSVTASELAYLTDVTGPIQAQLDTKAVIGGGLSQAGANTTSSDQLAAIMTDETGWPGGVLVFNNAPLLLTPVIDNGAAFLQEVAPLPPIAGRTLLYPKADNKWYSKDFLDNELPVGGGLLPLAISAGPITAAPGTHYLTNTTAGAFTINLPAGSSGASLKFTDAAETWAINNLTLVPSTGQKIDMLAINETLVCDVIRGWVELNWNGTYWVFGSLASTQVGEASATSAGIVTTGAQSFAGPKTFLGALTPSAGIVGRTDGISPSIGYIGEVLTSLVSTAAPIPAGSTAYGDATSLAMAGKPGTYAIYGSCRVNRNGATFSSTDFAFGVSTTPGNFGTGLFNSLTQINETGNIPTTFSGVDMNSPVFFVKFDGVTFTRLDDNAAFPAGTTLYLKLYLATFSPASPAPTYTAKLNAVRIG